MDDNQKLLDTVSAALTGAGYLNVKAQNDANAAVVTATKDAGGAYFRLMDKAKAVVPARTSAGGPEPQTAPLGVMMAPAFADLHDYLLRNPQLAPAFGLPAEALRQLK